MTGKIIHWIVLLVLFAAVALQAQPLTPGADQILEQVDQVFNAPKDQELIVQLILIDKNGKQKVREMLTMQKGSDRRLIRFLAPADQKGIAFLSLPGDMLYIYMPAFAKTRRIAGHVKNSKFAGTDFTYEDLEAKAYAEKWQPQLLGSDDTTFFLKLTLKPGQTSEYEVIKMWVRKDIFYPVKLEMFVKGEKLVKRYSDEKVDNVNGYWIGMESVLEDLRSGRKTIKIIRKIQVDTGMKDDVFTERYLSRS